MQVTLPDGTTVLARGRLDLVPATRPHAPDFALYLDERWRDDHDVSWPFHIVPWPELRTAPDENATFTEITDLYRRARAGEKVEVACYGGVGLPVQCSPASASSRVSIPQTRLRGFAATITRQRSRPLSKSNSLPVSGRR